MKKLLTNKVAENLLIGIILLFNARNWVYKFVPANTDYKPGSIRKAKRSGILYQLDLNDYQEWLVYFYCKSDSSDHLLNYLQNSEIIFDIGANIGQTAFNMFHTQKLKKLSPVIYAFEPYPRTFKKLETNSKLNKDIPLKIYNLGIGEKKGTLYMTQHSPYNSGGFRMTRDTANGVSVPIISLDEFVTEHQIPHIDFIKIDVEGFEAQVINGVKEAIEQFKPILIFEYSISNIRDQHGNIEEILDWLGKMNYQISTKEGVSDKGTILNLNYQTDLICIPH